jgi:hypothetical protein
VGHRQEWGSQQSNASEYVRVGDGAGSRGTAIESAKKAKWGLGGCNWCEIEKGGWVDAKTLLVNVYM